MHFACKKTEELYNTGKSKQYQAIAKVALRKLDMLNAATSVEDVRIPPANHLERLLGDRSGQWSIRINSQFRLCFEWDDDSKSAFNIEIVDYH